MDPVRLDYDDVAWERSDEVFDKWKHTLYSEGVAHQVAMLIQKHRHGIPEKIYEPTSGSSNVCLRLQFDDSRSAMIRFAVAGRVMFPEDKVRAEVAAMRFIADATTIPIPLVLHVGNRIEGPAGLGPFMIMEYVEHDRTISDVLNIPGRSNDCRPLLDPDIEPGNLKVLYGRLAQVALKKSNPSLPCIGSFDEVDEFEWSVQRGPMTFNMNMLVQLGDVQPSALPSKTFATASSYYCALADLHFEHLSAQHNDAVDDEQDCRRKYVARQLFRNLAIEGRLDSFPEFEDGPFRLYCEDLRPDNFLITEDNRVTGVVDWEFTIAAPAGLAFSPPWWLLLEHPTKWPWGLHDWEKEYGPRLETFLQVLKAQEDEEILKGSLGVNDRLSDHMRQSWDTGAFWIDYAAQRSWAFDHIFFNRIDAKFFGTADGDWLKQRLPLLTPEQRDGLEPFVQKKMVQKADRRLVDDRFEGLM